MSNVWTFVWRDSYGDVRIAWVIAGLLGAVAVAVFGLLVFVAAPLSERSCERTVEAMGREWRYSFFFEGCMVRLADGTYVPLDNYRLSNEEVGR